VHRIRGHPGGGERVRLERPRCRTHPVLDGVNATTELDRAATSSEGMLWVIVGRDTVEAVVAADEGSGRHSVQSASFGDDVDRLGVRGHPGPAPRA
jgi:hypothetical protein